MTDEENTHLSRAHMDRIDDRLRTLELQQQGASTRLENEVGNLVKMMSEIRDIIKRHDTMFFGNNGSAGLVTRLDRLEQTEKNRAWVYKVALGTSVTLVVKILWDIVMTHGH